MSNNKGGKRFSLRQFNNSSPNSFFHAESNNDNDFLKYMIFDRNIAV